MKKWIVVTMLVGSMFAQDANVVNEAKASLAAKYHKALVAKAEGLLERKKLLEAELSEIDEKLAKLANGVDVKTDPGGTVGYLYSTPSNCGTCFVSSSGMLVRSGN